MASSAQSAQPRPVVYLPTEEAYDQWAAIYDTDGNFLQAIDDRELETLLPEFVKAADVGLGDGKPRTVVDLGCGTGRNTLKLPALLPPTVSIIGVDSSPGMLLVAKAKAQKNGAMQRLTFDTFDIFHPEETALLRTPADAIISTLVIEHISTEAFFRAAASILKPHGRLLLTNMHSDMGNISQAGFVDPHTSTKIRPKSFAHTLQEVCNEAFRWGFEAVQKYERAVSAEDCEQLGLRSKKWIGIKCWYAVAFERLPR